MYFYRVRAVLPLVASLATGCVVGRSSLGDEGTGTGSGSQGTTVTDTGSDSQSPGTTTGADPETYCEQFDTPESCSEAAFDEQLPCQWGTFTPVRRDDEFSCYIGPEVTMCVTMTGTTTVGGCGITPGCEGSPYTAPYYKALPDGTALLVDQCGGSPPFGFFACETGLLDSEPPECACACALHPDGGGATDGP